MAMIMVAAVGIVPYHLTTPELCLQPLLPLLLLPLVVTFAAVSSTVHFLSLSFFLFMIAGVDCQNRLPLY